MKTTALPCAAFLLLALASLAPCPSAHAQQAPEGRAWAVQDPKHVEMTAAGIRFLPAATTPNSSRVTTALHLPQGKPWKVAFDIQMGTTLAWSMSLHLSQGKTDVAWLGCDSHYKSLSAFVGSGTANMPLSQPFDTAWHHFEYVSDGKTLALWHNGMRCGEGPLLGTPDTLEIGSTGQEMWVRNVHVGQVSALPASPASISFFSENFTSPNLTQQWDGANNGGTVALGDQGLKLEGQGKGYPVLTTRINPFPAQGNWTASFGYHYSSVGNYGTEIRCESADGNAVLLVHQDVHGQFLALNGKTVWQTPASTDWHVVSLVEKDQQMTAYLDGSQVGSASASSKPVLFRFGGKLMDNPWDWNNLEIDFVRVNSGVHPLDRSALNQRATPLEHLAKSSPSVAANPEPSPIAATSPPVAKTDLMMAQLNKQIDEHNALVEEGNKLEDMKSQYLLAYQQCSLAKQVADNSGQEGRYNEALAGEVQFLSAYNAACVQSDLVWSRARNLRSIIEANPLYLPTVQANSTDVTVIVSIHTAN